MREIKVVPYTSRWQKMYQEEAQNLKEILNPILIDLHHIGSTSVPGLAAKPVIDILAIVSCITEVEKYTSALVCTGYQALGECGIEGRRFFTKGGDSRTHHLHIFSESSPHITRHLAFRDYLRHNPAAVSEYAKLKTSLASRFPHDIEQYCSGKDDFIKKTEQLALRWYTNLDSET